MKRFIAKSIVTAAAACGLFSVPTIASARDHDHDGYGRGGVIIRGGREYAPRRIWIEPVYEERRTQVLVPATYRTICEDVWVAPVYRTVCEKVFVEPIYESRRVCRTDRFGRRIEVIERVCVREGGWRSVDRQVLAVAGHFEKVERQVCMTEARYETRCERIIARTGCWETVSYGHPRYDSGLELSFNFR